MARTAEQFAIAMDQVRWYVKFHNKPVWLVPVEDDYLISGIVPEPNELPSGTTALRFNQQLDVIASVAADT